jgi:hypothetical protein
MTANKLTKPCWVYVRQLQVLYPRPEKKWDYVTSIKLITLAAIEVRLRIQPWQLKSLSGCWGQALLSCGAPIHWAVSKKHSAP